PADGAELATHRVPAEGSCLTGFDADERLVATCLGDTVTSFAVARDGTVDRTAELDDCGYRQRTTSSPWAWDGGSVWDVVGREGRGDPTMVRLDDEPGVACSW
ncbi:MAG: hypothetical protein KC656_22030, partial [Myxococcales bacterium]|nr:hypothetical protein [Myxococcales bacterium]